MHSGDALHDHAESPVLLAVLEGGPVDRLRDAPADQRRALVRDLRKAQANLASLLNEIDDIDK